MDEATLALLEFTVKLTETPAAMTGEDVNRLREVGWDDRAVHDATQVCSYFNYINRIADALGVHPEDWMDLKGRRLED